MAASKFEGCGGLHFPAHGVIVRDWPPEATARVLGTGIEVWEIVRTYLEVGRNWERLRAAYDWLSPEQLDAALAFAKQHAAVIQDRIQREYAYLPPDLRPEVEPHWP
jgi:uncharacterized protein (DUF433 family)